MTDVRGGYKCPVLGCEVREFIQQLIDLHVKRDHPEETA